ncbi:CgeB family protein [Thalassospira permensis]|uniref:Spore protein YkvP/CgeB glycosyl transferase-like domain-containing protein n=1 Tax=Thalassospira permensis NBRC 106175 TaxID=1353532 RepID=A0ABR4TSX3_9PROT|nr:glycosyltransferase [Thalassospira permensis]KEO57888.1 hypothetical protein SMB34_04015 [Thalassospira permensis NBRC 106175]
MRVLCVFGKHQYGDPSRGLGIEYVSFIPALKKLGHEVLHFESWAKDNYKDFSDLNKKLLETVITFEPEIILTVHMSYEIWAETIDIISARDGVKTISWAADDSWKYKEVSRFIGRHYHVMTTTYDYIVPRYHKDGIRNVLLTQWAAPENWLSEPLPSKDCQYEVSFVGAAHGSRIKRVEELKKNGIEVACFGHGWPAGPVPAERIPFIIRNSKISLNFANSYGENQIKARTFEVPGCGGFLVTENARNIEKFYENGKEVIIFDTDKELEDLIKYYLANPEERDDIAQNGFSRTAREHTYVNRMESILNYSSSVEPYNRKKNNNSSLEKSIKYHRKTYLLTAIRKIICGLLCVIFGKRRGPRAARRLVFGLSWRFLGHHTFTAKGFPGRMFPDL